MPLDASTLAFTGGLVTFSSGFFLLVYWWQDRTACSAFWWAIANCSLGVGIVLMSRHGVVPRYASDIIGPQIISLAAVLAFVAARIFNGGVVNPYRLAGGVAGWFAVQAVAGVFWPEQFAAALGAGGTALLYLAAAVAFWRGRTEELRGRGPMIAVLVLQSIALCMTALQFASEIRYSVVPSVDGLGVIHFVALFYSLGVTLLLPVMLKGRSEEKYKRAALTDPLTGLANRRAFMDRAQRVVDRQGQDGRPVALLAFDLDHFKRINDTFGHAMGDRILRAFADVLLGTLRPTNLVARIGGEEFVAIVPGADDNGALVIANRIRDAFQRVALFVDGQRIGATVSVGVATGAGTPCNVIDLLAKADVVLYRAKEEGRNRAILATSASDIFNPTNVIRIA